MKKTSKVLMLCYLIFWTALFFTVSSSAYIDPSVMTFAIQAIVGVVIASSVVIFALWRKAKRKIVKTLGIDENAGKEVEDDVVSTAEVKEEKDTKDSVQ